MVLMSKRMADYPQTSTLLTLSYYRNRQKTPYFHQATAPISLINVDLKIIYKALAKRLEKITPLIIHPDQTGFIKERHSFINTHTG